MTATMAVDKDRTILWAVLASIAIHVLVLVPYLKNIVPPEFFQAQKAVPMVTPIEFELVSPPQDPNPSKNTSKYLSTVSSQASDTDPTNDDSALPKLDGQLPFPDTPSDQPGQEGGGERELPPLPEEQTDLTEAFKKSRFREQSSPSPKPSAPDQNPLFKHTKSARASFGGISINTTAWDFAPYLLELKLRIKQHWLPPFAFTALGAIHGFTKINFRIYPDGTMEALAVVETNGHESLHRASEGAIQGAAPFRPLPEEFPEDYLDITFGFYYLLPGDEDRFFERK